MRGLFRNKYIVALIVITLLIVVLMAISSLGQNSVHTFERIGGTLVSPFQKAFTAVGDWCSDVSDYFKSKKSLQDKNEEYEATIAMLQSRLAAMADLENENKALKDMLSIQETEVAYSVTSAEVIAKESGPWFSVFTIDKGLVHGIKLNQPVVVGSNGLVGQVSEVGLNWSKVVSIINSDSAAGALVARTRDVCMVEGDVNLEQQGLCKVTFIAENSGISVGDYIETSGIGGIYPKGLLIGVVKEVISAEEDGSSYAILEPTVGFNRISQVFVLDTENQP